MFVIFLSFNFLPSGYTFSIDWVHKKDTCNLPVSGLYLACLFFFADDTHIFDKPTDGLRHVINKFYTIYFTYNHYMIIIN